MVRATVCGAVGCRFDPDLSTPCQPPRPSRLSSASVVPLGAPGPWGEGGRGASVGLAFLSRRVPFGPAKSFERVPGSGPEAPKGGASGRGASGPWRAGTDAERLRRRIANPSQAGSTPARTSRPLSPLARHGRLPRGGSEGAAMAKVVRRRIRNAKIVGSNPACCTEAGRAHGFGSPFFPLRDLRAPAGPKGFYGT